MTGKLGGVAGLRGISESTVCWMYDEGAAGWAHSITDQYPHRDQFRMGQAETDEIGMVINFNDTSFCTKTRYEMWSCETQSRP